MADSNEMRLGRFGREGEINLNNIKEGLESKDLENLSSKAANIFRAYDINNNNTLDKNEISMILKDVKKYAKHGKNNIFSEREARKLLKENNIQNADVESYFELLKQIETKTLNSTDTIEHQEIPNNETTEQPVIQEPETPPSQTPHQEEENPQTVQENDNENQTVQQNDNENQTVQQNNQPQKEAKKDIITYAKEGETFDATAQRLGFKKGTAEYEAFVKANQKAKDRKWFMVGEGVIIPPSIQNKVSNDNLLSEKDGLAEVEKWKARQSTKRTNSSHANNSGSTTTSTHSSGTIPQSYLINSTYVKPTLPVGSKGKTSSASPVKSDNKVKTSKPTKPNNAQKPDTTLKADAKEKIDFLKQNGYTYTVSGDSSKGFTVNITAGKDLTNRKIYNINFKYDKNGKFLSKVEKFNNGQITETKPENGKRVTKTVQKAAAPKVQSLQANLQKTHKGNSHLEYDSASKKWICVQTGVKVKGSKVREIRTTLNNSSWQSKMTNADKEAYRKSHMNTMKKISSFFNKLTMGAVGTDYKQENENKLDPNKATDKDYYASQQITYDNGRVTKTSYHQGSESEIKNIKNSATQKPKSKKDTLRTATKISFNLPANAPKTAKKFTGTLADNKTKANLMKDLKIDNDLYNDMAQTAVGIAAHEMDGTNWGENPTSRLKMKNMLQEFDKNGDGIISEKERPTGSPSDLAGHHVSYGVTQIKYATYAKIDEVNKLFKKYGIKSAKDLNDPKKSAVATMIVLAYINKTQIQRNDVQNGIEQCQGTVATLKGYKLSDKGFAEKSADGSSESWTNEVTLQDALSLAWNTGNTTAIKKGYFKPTVWKYTNGVRKQVNAYKLSEDSASRKKAEELEKIYKVQDAERADQTRVFKNNTNRGEHGSVVFLPAMYDDKDKHLNTKQEREKLAQILTKNGVSKDYITQLTTAMANGELSFDFGLRQSEMESMRNGDVKLILVHLNKLKSTVNKDSKINTTDGIDKNEAKRLATKHSKEIFKAENEYKRAYLTNHAQIYNTTGSKNVLTSMSKGVKDVTYFDEDSKTYRRRGFHHEQSKGVNTKTTTGHISQQQNILATAAHNYVKTTNPHNTNSGNCLTGVKGAMKNAGIDISDMSKYGSVPKNVKNWFDVHSEMFTPIRYVKVDENKGRDIVESDIRNLPAGYIVIFIPEANSKYSSLEGHIAITNGNGQGLADASDNMQWADYESTRGGRGKGEHGTFFIYKLSDNWEVGENGKLKLKGK